MAKQKFELVDGNSSKFWHVEQKAKTQTVQYGRIGTTGQTKTKSFETAALAKASVEKLIQQKLKKGYVEVGAGGSSRKPATASRSNRKAPKSAPKFSAARFEKFFKPLKKNELKGHPKLTAALLKKMEKQHDIKFPSALVSLLKIQNGGDVEEPDFRLGRRDYEVEMIWPIRENGIEPMVPEFSEHLELAEHGRLAKPELIFPIYGDGHFFYALDYRKSGRTKEPQVVYLDIEYRITCKTIANSFDEFLAGWQKPDINAQKKIDIDLVDPKRIIGTGMKRTLMKHERRVPRATRRSWLCVVGDHLEHYELLGWQYKDRKGKWKNEFEWEFWTKDTIKLTDIHSAPPKAGSPRRHQIQSPILRSVSYTHLTLPTKA